MSILTKAALDAAARTRFALYFRSGPAVALTTRYTCPQLNSNLVGVGALTTPAAIGSGGTLWSNGTAGFPQYPATDSRIAALSFGGLFSTGSGQLAIYDMVWAASGVTGNTSGPQSVSSFPTLSRPDVDGTGLELFLFVKTSSSNTSTGVTVIYTNSAGSGSQSASLLFGATTGLAAAEGMLPFKLADGSTGVKSIQSVEILTPQAVAGDLWLVLGRRLCVKKIDAYKAAADAYSLGCPVIGDSAALTYVGLTGAAGISSMHTELVLAHG